MTTRHLIAFAVAWALAFPVAHAQQKPKSSERKETAAEILKADANQDGQVTLDELKALRPGVSAEQFSKLDRNKDGVLSRADREMASGDMRAQLKKADADHDGKVTLEEFKQLRPQLTPERFAALDRNGDGALSEADIAPKRDNADARERFKKMDTDQDGQVSYEELVAVRPKATKEQFAKLDGDSDGRLTPTELASVAEQMRSNKSMEPASRDTRAHALTKLLAADRNGDSKVTFDEVQASKPGFPKEAYDRFDRNADGVLSLEDGGASR